MGRGRLVIVVSKLFSFAVLIIILTLPYTIVCVAGFASKFEFAPLIGIPSSFFAILSNICGVEATGSGIAKSIVICILIMYVYIGRLSICIPVAFKFKKSIPVIITGFITSFAFDIVNVMLAKTEGLSNFISFFPYQLSYDLTMNAEPGILIKAIICTTIYIVVMCMTAYAFFRRDEIK